MVHHYGHSTETAGGPGPPTTEPAAAGNEPAAAGNEPPAAAAPAAAGNEPPAAAAPAAAGDAAASAQMTAAAAALQEHSGCSEASAVATVSVLAAVAAIENPQQQQQAAPATPLAGTSTNDGWSIVTPAVSSPATDANAVPPAATTLDETSWPPLRVTALQQQQEAPAQELAEAAAIEHPQQQQEAPAQNLAAAAAIEHVEKDFPGLAAAASAAENGQPMEQLSQPLQQQLQLFSEGHQHATDGTPPDAAMPTVTAPPRKHPHQLLQHLNSQSSSSSSRTPQCSNSSCSSSNMWAGHPSCLPAHRRQRRRRSPARPPPLQQR